MRSTITLNGISSNTIQGLLIQSLPPISKPLMRTQIEEIDGRDGDVITKLGFSAYTKQITIGLHGNFDINQVISYFNSEGTVIFSNEPDKYYYYQILEQIDFERLIRFRTATVTMHVQPFKYSTTQGTEVFDNSSNLLTIPNFTKTTNGITVTVANNTISVSGTGTAATEFYIPIDTLSLSVGKYGMYALGSGTNPEACSLRVIYNSPSNANSFGGNYVTLQNNKTVSLLADLSNAKTYNYVYLYIAANQALNFTLNLSIEDAAQAVVSGEGSLITLENTAFAPFSKFNVKGDTYQQTYTGKNLLSVYNVGEITRNGITMTANSDGSLTFNGTCTGSAFSVKCSDTMDTVLPQGSYTYSRNAEISGISGLDIIIYKNTGVRIGSSNNDNSYTFTSTGSDIQTYYIWAYISVGTTFDNYTIRPQIEAGSTATSYEPYVGGMPSPNTDYPQAINVVTGTQTVTITDGASQSQAFTISLGSIELCKIGNCQDYIYRDGENWYVHKEIGKVVLDGSENWVKNSNYTNTTRFTLQNIITNATERIVMSDYFTEGEAGSDVPNIDINNNSYTIMLTVPNSVATDVTQLTTWLSSNNVIVYYILATPTDTQITDTVLISQLEALVTDAHAYRNTTTLVSTSEDLPHIMSVEVAKNNDATITNSGNTTARPVMTVYGSGTVGIYLNGNQIFTVNIGNNQYITIDTANMEAYKDTTNNLMNRLVDGDYSNFVLQTGANTISFSGTVSKLEISNYSRWI